VQASSDEIRRVAADLAMLRDGFGRSEVAFEINALPIDIVPDHTGRERYAQLTGDIEALGMPATFQVVPWYFGGGDPNDLSVRRDAILACGEALIDTRIDRGPPGI